MIQSSPSQLLAEIEALASNPPKDLVDDTELRTKLYNACSAARSALERPTELVVRVLLSLPVESAMVNTALDLELFPLLQAGDGEPKSLASLSTATGADQILLRRILRVLAASGAVKENGNDTYTLASNYSLFANPAFNNSVRNCGKFLDPTFQEIPNFLKSTKYQNPADPKNTAIQKAFKQENSSVFEIMSDKPAAAQGLGVLLNTWADGHAFLHQMYPVKESLVESFDHNSSPVFFVDVGGATGQKAIALKESLPNVPGNIIVQDLPVYIKQAPNVDGVEFMAHDFFTEQPIKDDACVKILRRLRQACKPGYSKVLIHEQVVPEVGASAELAVEDITMMALCGVGERTEKEWTDIVQNAGLNLLAVYPPKDGVSESVIEAGLEA
ncbi:S-adenosyl-L-methionine-dependent methyltransferase [Lentithecium fluviatile CBS 122367]|uniref:S-adenosyl-L-methionine-dependent methyltransferase n=1 Tax=Lentithecium fluviatile CBS 122367 TaxID=1168545 RepID=A0A6G1IFZ9_9PLEO|nr:S-adenosyl-L-methionine-dependent methyltransferase [Lentithecium fluviatile CBS 122367]